MQVLGFFVFVALTIVLTVVRCDTATSADRQLKTRQAHAEGSELFTGPGAQVPPGGQSVDQKSLQEIQEDFARLMSAGSTLQTLISKMSQMLNSNANSKSADFTQYNAGAGGGYNPVGNFVKLYKSTYGYNGYPNIAQIPCAGIPTANTLPTIPVLIKRITADTTYLMDLYNRGLVTTTTNVRTQVANQGINSGVVLTPYDDHHHK